MPYTPNEFNPDDPLDRFTLALRALHREAKAAAASPEEFNSLTIPGLSRATGMSRATVHAALGAQGSRGFLSEETLLRILIELKKYLPDIASADWCALRDAALAEPFERPARPVESQRIATTSGGLAERPATVSAPTRLAEYLAELRLQKGNPSFQSMAAVARKRTSSSALAELLRGSRQPRWDTVRSFLEGIGASSDEERRARSLWQAGTAPRRSPRDQGHPWHREIM